MEKYIEAFSEFVHLRLPEFYDGLKEFYAARGKGDPDSLSYFMNHLPRFEAMIGIVLRNIDTTILKSLCELGSFYPYTTYYFKWLNDIGIANRGNVTIDIYDIILRELKADVKPYDVDGVRFIDINFCTEPLPEKKYDLIILSEVIEHLPINLFAFEKEVIRLLEVGGYIVVTYPTRGRNAQDYDREFRDRDWNRLQEDHIREFTKQTVKLFFKDLTLVDQRSIHYRQMGRCEICLYQR